LGFSESTNSYIIMDYYDYKIHNVREIYCQEDSPGKLSLSNEALDGNEYPSFFNFDFNFSKANRMKLGTLKAYYYQDFGLENSINNTDKGIDIVFQNSKDSVVENNIKNYNKNINNPKENTEDSEYTFKNSRKNTKNNEDNASNNEELNKTIEDHVENDDSDEFFDIIDDEKIFNNKNFNDFEQKIENNNDKNNNLSSKIFHEKLNVSQNDNPNLPNMETKENSNFNNKVENSINNKVQVNKNLIDNSLNNSNNNEEKQFTDIISDSKLVHIENESKINSNSNINSKEYTDNILKDKVDFTSSPNVNKTHFNLNPKGKRKELIIYKNVNVPQDILKLKKIINNNNFKLNKFKNFNFDYNSNNNVSVILNKNNKRPLEDNSTVIYSKNLSVERPNKFRNINFNKFVASINSVTPFSFSDAIQQEDHIVWEKAIMDELNNLYNNIFTFVKFVPPNKTIISTKWVFSTKKDINNKIIKRKARLVARGFNQRRGIDYELTYSPTLNIDCLK